MIIGSIKLPAHMAKESSAIDPRLAQVYSTATASMPDSNAETSREACILLAGTSVSMPRRCACCAKASDEHYTVKRSWQGEHTYTTLTLNIPICTACLKHASDFTRCATKHNMRYLTVFGGFPFLWAVALPLIISWTFPTGFHLTAAGFYGLLLPLRSPILPFVAAVAFYRCFLKGRATPACLPELTSECVSYEDPVQINSAGGGQYLITMRNPVFAQQIAILNNCQIEWRTVPSFKWTPIKELNNTIRWIWVFGLVAYVLGLVFTRLVLRIVFEPF